MASQLKVDTITGVTTAGSVAVTGEGNSTTTNLQQGLGKVWVNFDGTASGAAARDSFNVSGMTDNGTGLYTVTFSNNMANDDYATQVTGGETGADGVSNQIGTIERNGTYSTSQVKVNGHHTNTNSDADNNVMFVHVSGDLA